MGRLAIHKRESSVLQELTPARQSILATLAYYDIFHYPLTAPEIRQFLGTNLNTEELQRQLVHLEADGLIFFHHGFYSLQDNPLLSHRRRQGNQNAVQLLVKARKIGRFLGRFPFVKAIGISGSLSKNYADEKADIDFFIITRADRLWIARSLMHLYKKFTFLFGRQHLYCMNYYVDEKALLLEDQNIFTAIEIKTLLPVYGEKTLLQFFTVNDWANQFLPACAYRLQEQKDRRNSWLKKSAEWCLKGKAGSWLESKLYRLTRRRWKNKEEKGRRNKKGQAMELITGPHFAKSNPGAFQEKVLVMYSKKIEELKIRNRQ